MMSMLWKRILKIIVLVIIIGISLFLLLLLRLSSVRWASISRQERHLEELRELYQQDYDPVDEQAFANFDLDDPSIRLNEIRMIASHNSYKTRGTDIGKFFVGLGDSFEEAKALKYANPPLTEQLDKGIRSFELDVRYRRDTFEAIHVPLVDNGSTAVNLALAFEEIALWSEHNPNHVPILLLLEFKDDWMMLDPALKPIEAAEFALFDTLLQESFGETLYTPSDLMGSHSSIQARLEAESWPTLQELRGKILVILHPGDFIDPYVATDSDLSELSMFPGMSNLDVDAPYAAFVVHNDPDVAAIGSLLDQRLIVRTRIDANLVRNPDTIQAAMDSGAQIMSTDFHPAHLFKDETYQYLEEEYTVVLNDVLLPGE